MKLTTFEKNLIIIYKIIACGLLFLDGLFLDFRQVLITKQKKNTKKKGLMEFSDRLLLRKRAVIESMNDFLKNICQIEHSRHRSCRNFIVNLVSGLAAYSFLPKKPSLYIIYNAVFHLAHIFLGVFKFSI